MGVHLLKMLEWGLVSNKRTCTYAFEGVPQGSHNVYVGPSCSGPLRTLFEYRNHT